MEGEAGMAKLKLSDEAWHRIYTRDVERVGLRTAIDAELAKYEVGGLDMSDVDLRQLYGALNCAGNTETQRDIVKRLVIDRVLTLRPVAPAVDGTDLTPLRKVLSARLAKFGEVGHLDLAPNRQRLVDAILEVVSPWIERNGAAFAATVPVAPVVEPAAMSKDQAALLAAADRLVATIAPAVEPPSARLAIGYHDPAVLGSLHEKPFIGSEPVYAAASVPVAPAVEPGDWAEVDYDTAFDAFQAYSHSEVGAVRAALDAVKHRLCASVPAQPAVEPWEGPLSASEQQLIDGAWEKHKAATPVQPKADEAWTLAEADALYDRYDALCNRHGTSRTDDLRDALNELHPRKPVPVPPVYTTLMNEQLGRIHELEGQVIELEARLADRIESGNTIHKLADALGCVNWADDGRYEQMGTEELIVYARTARNRSELLYEHELRSEELEAKLAAAQMDLEECPASSEALAKEFESCAADEPHNSGAYLYAASRARMLKAAQPTDASAQGVIDVDHLARCVALDIEHQERAKPDADIRGIAQPIVRTALRQVMSAALASVPAAAPVDALSANERMAIAASSALWRDEGHEGKAKLLDDVLARFRAPPPRPAEKTRTVRELGLDAMDMALSSLERGRAVVELVRRAEKGGA